MKENVTLKSGRVLILDVAPFKDARQLSKVVCRELSAINIDLGTASFKGLSLDSDVGALLSNPGALSTIKNVFAQLLASDALEKAIFDCAIRCTLNDNKVTIDAFEAPNMRGDFLPVAWEVMRFNLAPFFANLNLSSLTSGLGKKSGP